jgi:hypothetical protein
MPIDAPSYATLSAMITPALFMTANGSLIISTSNRMSRVVDRIRSLNEQSDALARGVTGLDYPRERQKHIEDQVERLLWRSALIRLALVELYLAFGLFVGTSLMLGLDVLLAHRVVGLPTTMAIGGVCLLFAASVGLVREALAALRSNQAEIRFYRDLRALRLKAARAGAEAVLAKAAADGPDVAG